MSISCAQLATLLAVSPRVLERRAEAEGWHVVASKPVRFALAGLPAPVRRVVEAAQAGGAHVEEPLALPGCALPPARAPRLEVPTSERSKRKALDQHRLAEAFQQALDTAPHGEKDQAAKAFALAYNAGTLFPEIFARVGKRTLATFRLWAKQYRRGEGDYMSFCPAPRRVQQTSLTQLQQDALLKIWLHSSRPSIRLAWQGAIAAAGPMGYDPAYRFLKAFERRNHHVVLLAREGEKALKDKPLPYITRDSFLLSVGEVVADGHVLNFTILHPRTGKPARLMLVMMYDWASRMPVGWQIMPTESTIAVSAALRMACQTLGCPPKHLLLDNGKAFKAKVFTASDPDFGDFSGLYSRLGIGVHFAAPYNARSKVIERFLLTLQEQFEPLMPSYSGSSIADKPAHLLRNEAFHARWHEARTGGWVPTLQEAGKMLAAYITWYGASPHDGLDGLTPESVFRAGLPEPSPELAKLDREFLWRKQGCTVRNCRIKLHGVEYESTALLGIKGKVDAYYDTADMSSVELLADGESLGHAEPVAALHPLVALLEDGAGLADLKHALAKQRDATRQAKRGLADALGETGEDLAEVLQWKTVKPVAAPKKAKALPAAPKALPEETDRLRAIAQAAVQEPGPQATRPEFFASDFDRYEWAFRARLDGQAIPEADAAWAQKFEQSEAFDPYRQRFEDLTHLAESRKRAAA